MMRIPIFIISIICLVGLLLQCEQKGKSGTDRAADEAAIRKADSTWSVTTGKKQINEFMGFVADDGVIQAPNAPIAEGRDAIQKLMSGFFSVPGFFVKWQATKVEVAGSGDMGYSIGKYELNVNDEHGKPITDNGKYTTIWKKQIDRNWKVVIDMFNSDLPAQSPLQK